VAAIAAGATVMLIALVHELWAYYFVFGVLNGLTRPMLQVIGLSEAITHWFVRRRALAASLVSLGFPLSGLVGLPLAALLVEHVGWRAAWVIVGAIPVVAVAVPAWFLWRPAPAALGLLPDGDAPPRASLHRLAQYPNNGT